MPRHDGGKGSFAIFNTLTGITELKYFQLDIDAIVTRYGATSTSYEWQSKWGTSTTTHGANYTTDTSAITWANANNFLCAVYNTTPGTQTLTLNEYNIEFVPR